MTETARNLVESTGGVLDLHEAAPEPGSLPGLEILDGQGRTVATWSAAPTGPEGPPFLELLTVLCGAQWEGQPGGRPGVEVLIAAECPNCPNAVRAAVELLAQGLVSRLHVVDVRTFPAEARVRGIASVPVTICDELVLSGVRSPGELAGALESWGTAAWMEEVLAAHLAERRVDRAVALLEDGSGVGAFGVLWRRSSLATRLGLMLAAQMALENVPRALDGAIVSLVPLLESEAPPLRGDTAELLGWIGHPSAVPALRRLARDPHPELAAAAAEALERLERTGADGP